MKSHTQFALALAVVLAAAPVAHADPIALVDGDSTALIDPNSQAGMYYWAVEGQNQVPQNQLYQQWFWYRIGDNGPEYSIDTISAPTVSRISNSIVQVSYDNANFGVSIRLSLTGGATVAPGSVATADIGEQITMTNHTAAAVNAHFFQYSDFDLGGPGGDNVQLLPMGPLGYLGAYQQDGPNNISETTVVAPGANRGSVDYFATTLNLLNSGSPVDLNNNNGPVGPGDVTWALQWNMPLDANGGTGQISKDKYLSVMITPSGGVPEPATIGLLACGAAALLLRRRRA
jgi:hypothetical protein